MVKLRRVVYQRIERIIFEPIFELDRISAGWRYCMRRIGTAIAGFCFALFGLTANSALATYFYADIPARVKPTNVAAA